MPAPASFEYAVIRVVPRVERGEFINAGVVLFCRTRRFLAAQVELDRPRLAALASDLDSEPIQRLLDAIPLVCAGAPEAGAIGRLSQSERFHWLVAPVSTIIQASPVHSGLCHDPTAALEHLMETMVRSSKPTSPASRRCCNG